MLMPYICLPIVGPFHLWLWHYFQLHVLMLFHVGKVLSSQIQRFKWSHDGLQQASGQVDTRQLWQCMMVLSHLQGSPVFVGFESKDFIVATSHQHYCRLPNWTVVRIPGYPQASKSLGLGVRIRMNLFCRCFFVGTVDWSPNSIFRFCQPTGQG